MNTQALAGRSPMAFRQIGQRLLRQTWERLQTLPSDVAKSLPKLIAPLLGLCVFLLLWQVLAARVETSLGNFPGPTEVYEQASNLWAEHKAEMERADAFYARQEARNEALLARNPNADVRIRDYTGKPTFIDQIGTSLITVATGFLIGSAIAIPLGILIGLSPTMYAAMNPVIQLLRPVSPLAWLPLVTIVVAATYQSADPLFAKSFLVSAICVLLCSLWPTLVNTAVGASSVSSDLVNVSRVLRLSKLTHIVKIVLPSSVPMIFAGLRLSLGVAWMVLIASEMLAQNPGLGKFVWDEFQNGSSQSLGRIMVAVVVIGLIGFLLDRGMLALQRAVSWDKTAILR
ncbi:MAG: ABC transporter permease [Pseudomonadota bacterium]|jgi:nitrate/nitrite transport system permease protein|nr:ABC transporter permease [Pseudomonadota bacterium]